MGQWTFCLLSLPIDARIPILEDFSKIGKREELGREYRQYGRTWKWSSPRGREGGEPTLHSTVLDSLLPTYSLKKYPVYISMYCFAENLGIYA